MNIFCNQLNSPTNPQDALKINHQNGEYITIKLLLRD